MEKQRAGFDRNQLTGILLIAVLMVGFGWWQSSNMPERQPGSDNVQNPQDSTSNLNDDSDKPAGAADFNSTVADTIASAESMIAANDSNAFKAEEFTIENKELRLTFSTLGAKLVHAQLRKHKTYLKDTLSIINNNQSWDIIIPGDEALSTKEFELISHTGSSIIFGSGETEVKVSLPEKGFVVNYTVNGNSVNGGNPVLTWERTAYRTEKGISNERIYSTYAYKLREDGDVENLSGSGVNQSNYEVGAVDWLAQKQHFFSFIVHPEQGFSSARLTTVNGGENDTNTIKTFRSESTIDQTINGAYSLPFTFYIGPNQYQSLKSLDQDYEKIINFGWGIFGWIGRGVVVPIFNWLEGYGLNYGLIILIMVLIIKGALSPLTFASYRSMAKMRVLKPQIEAIHKKYPNKKDAMAKQQAQMALYREAGVNPLGGCIPVLVQMPILFAMFRFFPSSFELRGQSFLWATDLSTYDALISWDSDIPILSTLFGNHISIFTLLMTGSTILYTRMNQSMSASTGSSGQMKQMQVIMYLMPLIFMFVLNSYPAGLTYYYFLSNIVTFGMQWAIRRSLNDEAILAKIEEKKSQPKKQSRFQARLEEMQRQQNLNRSQRRK